MLADLKPASHLFRFGTAELHIRYDMAALLALEEGGHGYEDIFSDEIKRGDLAAFLTAGVREEIGTERADGIIYSAGGSEVWQHCREAMLLALPAADPTVIPDLSPQDSGVDFAKLRTLVCDIMGKSDDFFWSSTLRELMERWQNYAVIKGYAKEPERMAMFDDEGL